MEEIVFKIILHAGEARTSLIEAMSCTRAFDFTGCAEYLDKATKSIQKAHQTQTELIRKEVNGETQCVSLLMVHAQDHLASAISMKEMVYEINEMVKSIDERLKKVE